MMYDVLPSSALISPIMDSPDLLALLSILFLVIVAIAVAATLLDMAHSLRKRSH
jgi:hypothetical protein